MAENMEDKPAFDRGEREERGERPDRGDYGDRGEGDDRRGRGGPRRFHRGKVCVFCVEKSVYVDYKDLERLRRYLTDRGKLLPRRITGNCAHHQRMLTTAVKRARNIALIPCKAK